MISSFRGKYDFLSNFYERDMVWEGVKYRNSEAAFQSAKCKDKKDRVMFSDLSAKEAKRLGRRVDLVDNWDVIKDDIMYEVCKAKFTQNDDLKNMLISTGDEELVEGNTWGDRYWGMVRGVGKNRLGLILMKIREELS